MNKTKINKNKTNSTAVITDIRNFSHTFKKFQNKDSDTFLQFIEKYYNIQTYLATVISDNIYMSSTGDGVLTIFTGNNNHKNGYAYILSSHKALSKLCDEFISQNEGEQISFGIGADSGNVWSVGKDSLNTFVGTVINRASRIEGLTKLFGKTTTTIGNSLYSKLVEEFYPSSYEIMQGYKDYDELLDENPESILISKQFLLQYVFDMHLQGIQSDAPIFRLSRTLVGKEDRFNDVMLKLIGEEKFELIKDIMK